MLIISRLLIEKENAFTFCPYQLGIYFNLRIFGKNIENFKSERSIKKNCCERSDSCNLSV